MLSIFIEWFALDRQAGVSNLLWRWLTAHAVHFTVIHGLLNLAGILAIAAINHSYFFSRQGLFSVLFLCLWISAGIWWLNPEIITYAGLSGALHGLFVVAVTRSDHYNRPLLKGSLLLLWIGKVVLEQSGLTDVSGKAEWLGVAVAVDAHLYGLVGGILLAGLFYFQSKAS